MMKRILGILALWLTLSPVAMAVPNHSGITDKGVVRPQNEDSFYVNADKGIYVVADGMGGHAAGEVASKMAVDAVNDYVHMPIWEALDGVWPNAKIAITLAAYHVANRQILADSLNSPAHRGMGTTMVSLVLHNDHADVINVGDSRAYRIRNGNMVQVSHDHSLVQEYIDTGVLKTPEEIEAFPYKNIITQAMGTQPKIVPDVFPEPQISGDIYLLCSDGLVNELREKDILNIISENVSNLETAGQILVQKAKEAGGHDNITVVLVQVP